MNPPILIIALIAFISSVSGLPIDALVGTKLQPDLTDENVQICSKALCSKIDVKNSMTSTCSSYKYCGKCSVSTVENHPLCYLLENNPDYSNLTEGILSGAINNIPETDKSTLSDVSDSDYDFDDSFLQKYVSSSMQFIPSGSAADFDMAKRICAVDSKGEVHLKIKFVMQWFKINPKEHEEHEHHEDHSFLQMHHEDPDAMDVEHKGRNMHQTFKRLVKMKKTVADRLKSSKGKIHFMFSNPKVNSCRQPLIYKGKLPNKSMLIGIVEPRIPSVDLTFDLVRASTSAIVECTKCEKIRFNTCVQVSCKKILPTIPVTPTVHPIFPQMVTPLITAFPQPQGMVLSQPILPQGPHVPTPTPGLRSYSPMHCFSNLVFIIAIAIQFVLII